MIESYKLVGHTDDHYWNYYSGDISEKQVSAIRLEIEQPYH